MCFYFSFAWFNNTLKKRGVFIWKSYNIRVFLYYFMSLVFIFFLIIKYFFTNNCDENPKITTLISICFEKLHIIIKKCCFKCKKNTVTKTFLSKIL